MTDPSLAVIKHVAQFHDPVGVCLGHEDVFGERVTLKTLRECLRGSSLDYWIGLVARLDRAIYGLVGNAQRQAEIAKRTFLPADLDAFVAAERRDPQGKVVLVHPQQLLALLRLALTTEGVEPPPANRGFREDVSIGAVLLAVTDLLGDVEAQEPILEIPQHLREDRIISHWWRAGAVQGQFFTARNADIYWRLLVEIPAAIDVAEDEAVNAAIERTIGLRIGEFISLGYAILSGVWQGDPLGDAPVTAVNYPVDWLKPCRMEERKKRVFVDLNSATLDKLRKHAAADVGSRSFRYDFGWLEKWPLIDLGDDGRVVAPSVELLFQRISRGLYPLLLNRAKRDSGLQERVQRRRARATERFVRDAFQRMGTGARRLLPVRMYKSAEGEVEAGDAVPYFPEAGLLVVAEVKSGQSAHGSRPIGTASDLFAADSDLDRALRTLSRICRDAHAPDASGYPIDEIGARLWRRLVPLVVTDEPLFHDSFLRRRVDREAADRGLPANEFAARVGIVSFAEVDQLCDDEFREVDVAQLLDLWLSDEKARCLSLHEFLRRKGFKSRLDDARDRDAFPPRRVREVLNLAPAEGSGARAAGGTLDTFAT